MAKYCRYPLDSIARTLPTTERPLLDSVVIRELTNDSSSRRYSRTAVNFRPRLDSVVSKALLSSMPQITLFVDVLGVLVLGWITMPSTIAVPTEGLKARLR